MSTYDPLGDDEQSILVDGENDHLLPDQAESTARPIVR